MDQHYERGAEPGETHSHLKVAAKIPILIIVFWFGCVNIGSYQVVKTTKTKVILWLSSQMRICQGNFGHVTYLRILWIFRFLNQ